MSRFDRLQAFDDVGAGGIDRLREAEVSIVGLGGLGCVIAAYLGAAGVGKLTLIDDALLDEPDLGRQWLYSPKDLGRPKVELAAQRLREQNPELNLVTHVRRLTHVDDAGLLEGASIAVEGTDSLGARRTLNKICVTEGRPVVFGGAVRGTGFVQTVAPGHACFECVWTDRTLCGSCEEIGLVPSLVGVIGSLQATEVLKLILGIGTPLLNRIELVDVLAGTARTLDVRRRADCQVCRT
jgi:adenylyltransferase/sulfurtransferase